MATMDQADLADAMDEGFRQDTAEKVYRLLGILREIQLTAATRDKFTLKGGTALNIFHLPSIPRLSVDIDLVATGYSEAWPDHESRKDAINAATKLAKSLGYRVDVNDSEDSGCTIHCNYTNSLGTPDKVKIDIDFLNRKLLVEPEIHAGPAMFQADDIEFPIVAIPELMAQKLVAVCYRAHVRDLYDMAVMLREGWHKDAATRRLYLAYSFLKDHEWYRLNYLTKLEPGKFDFHPEKIRDVVRAGVDPPTLDDVRSLAVAELNPDFIQPTEEEMHCQKRLIRGDTEAFADLLQEMNSSRRKYLMESQALQFRLSQIAKR